MEQPVPPLQSSTDERQEKTDNGPDKIAIIAVHGVGSQTAHTTAYDLAGLLQRANPDTYSKFSTAVLDLEVVKTRVPDEGPAATEAESAWYVRTRFARAKAVAAPGAKDATATRKLSDDLAFTSSALAGVEIDSTLRRYQTRVISGRRSHQGRSHAVDVYEMYWADLSHLGGWLGQVLGQFYQLLFHVATLGQKTVELAWANSKPAERSRLTPVLIAQTVVEWLLAGVLPVANLALLLAILPAAVTLLPDDGSRNTLCATICGAIAAFAILAAGCFAIWKRVRKRDYFSSGHALKMKVAIAVVITIVAAALVAVVTGKWVHDFAFWWYTPTTLLFIVLSVICAGLLAWVSHRFSLHRSDKYSGASISAPNIVMLASLLVWAAILLTSLYEFPAEPDETILLSTLRIVEGLFFLVQLSWTLFGVAAWATCGFGWWALARGAPGKIRAAIWTGKMALFIPATLFMLVTLLLWSAFSTLFKKLFSDIDGYDSLFHYSADLVQQITGCGTTSTLFECMDRLVEISAGQGFNIFLVFVLLAVVFAIVGTLPSLIHESRPTPGGDPAESAALGTWLDAGFIVLRIAGYINLFALLVVLPAVQLAYLVPGLDDLKDVIHPFTGSSALLYMTGVMVGAAGILVMFRSFLFDGLGNALDIGLDVDNWLRERPIEVNPRGRILSRYLSLLNHVSDPKNGYARIVIVSHSQGTVISADLLRYLKAVPGMISRRLPTTLLTFGSPLRQLYGLRFPDLYGWARSSAVTSAIPDAAALDIDKWVNGYRSGDYVGRYFWTETQQWRPYAASSGIPHGNWEFCVGAGAHTHYFDACGTVVGKVIDNVIFGEHEGAK